MANKTCKTLVGIVKDVMIQIDKLSFLVDFVILDIKAYPKIPFNLGRPFMKTMRMLVGIDKGELMVRIKDREVYYKVVGITSTVNRQATGVKKMLVMRQPNPFRVYLVSLLFFFFQKS